MLYIIDVIYLLILKSLHILKDKAPKVYVITLGVDFFSWLIKYFGALNYRVGVGSL